MTETPATNPTKAPLGPSLQDGSFTHTNALASIRKFLSETSCYSILPESFRLIVLDNGLTIKRALLAMTLNSVASAPLYDSGTSGFAGMLTYTDFIHLIQYYYLTASTYASAETDVESLQLHNLRDIEQEIGVAPPPTLSIHPDKMLLDASTALARTHARRIPLVDRDAQTGNETILSVLTQYRLLKFIAINCAQDCSKLCDSIGSLGIGTYTSCFSLASNPSGGSTPNLRASASRRSRARSVLLSQPQSRTQSATGAEDAASPATPNTPHTPQTATQPLPAEESSLPNPSSNEEQQDDPFFPLATATMSTKVSDVVHLFSELGISGLPVVEPNSGRLLNLYETIDVVDLVRQNAYNNLDLTIEQALNKRSKDFPGVVVCTPEDTLANVLNYIRDKRVHRMVIVNHTSASQKGGFRLVGVLTLSDILRHLVGREDLDPLQLVGLGVQGESASPQDLPVAEGLTKMSIG